MRVGPVDPTKIGFLGYEDVQTDKSMKQLAGITLIFFKILLNLIKSKEKERKNEI